jgi:type 1 fimbria pilin
MKLLLKLMGALLVLLAHSSSYAMACSGNGGYTQTDVIESTVAVPLDLPRDSVLWRSETRTLEVFCWQDQMGPREYVYLYLNPYNDMGPNVELGVNLDGIDYRCSITCRVPISSSVFPGCNKDGGCPEYRMFFRLVYNYFISKKVGPLPPGTPPEGPLANVPDPMIAFQLDGEGGMNNKPAKNFRMYLSGVKNIRYVNCSVAMDIFPNLIYFDTGFSYHAEKDKKIDERNFSVSANRQCPSAAYGLDIVFQPADNSTVSASKDMLIPKDNDSVGIKIMDKSRNNYIEFGKPFDFAPINSNPYIIREFGAQLFWRTNKPKTGEYNAAATVDFYYK